MNIQLNCYTYLEQIRSTFPIQLANKFYPVWWKNLPPTYTHNPQDYCPHERSTMKTCPGFTDLFSYGFMLPLWCDVIIEIHADGSFGFRFADETSQIIFHDRRQMGPELFPDYIHAKFCSPWRITCNDDTPFMYTQPVWNFEEPIDYVVPTGVVNFKHQHGTEINMYFKKPKEGIKRIEMFAGQPLAHIIPLSQENLEINTHTVTMETWDQYAGYNHSFVHRYAKEKKFKSKNENN